MIGQIHPPYWLVAMDRSTIWIWPYFPWFLIAHPKQFWQFWGAARPLFVMRDPSIRMKELAFMIVVHRGVVLISLFLPVRSTRHRQDFCCGGGFMPYWRYTCGGEAGVDGLGYCYGSSTIISTSTSGVMLWALPMYSLFWSLVGFYQV